LRIDETDLHLFRPGIEMGDGDYSINRWALLVYWLVKLSPVIFFIDIIDNLMDWLCFSDNDCGIYLYCYQLWLQGSRHSLFIRVRLRNHQIYLYLKGFAELGLAHDWIWGWSKTIVGLLAILCIYLWIAVVDARLFYGNNAGSGFMTIAEQIADQSLRSIDWRSYSSILSYLYLNSPLLFSLRTDWHPIDSGSLIGPNPLFVMM
jgi:hypothetical protein